MSVIENFAALPAQEQRKFAEALLKTINSEKIFSSETDFELDQIEVDEFTGGLILYTSQTDTIEVSRKATWDCSNAEEAESDPGYDAIYENSVYKDAEKAFKTLSTVIDGYKVSVNIVDVDEISTVEVTTNTITDEDAGIGDYEYWGTRGYDSRPYVEVEGTLIKECECAVNFIVEPDDAVEAEPERVEN